MNPADLPALLVGIGLVGGMFGGMLGLGGGWLFGPSLSIFGLEATHVVGTSIAAMVAQACMSTYRYHKRGRLNVRIGVSFGAFAIVGMESGRRLLLQLTALGAADTTLRSLYVVALVLIGLSIWPRRGRLVDNAAKPPRRPRLPGPRATLYGDVTISWLALATIGFGIGNLSGILGIGGGTVMIPLLAALYGMPMLLSVPTSLMSILCAATYGVVANAVNHRVEGLYAVYLVVGAVLGGNLGASLALHAEERLLRQLFATLAWLTAVSVALRLGEQRTAAYIGLFGGSLSLATVAVLLVLRQRRRTKTGSRA